MEAFLKESRPRWVVPAIAAVMAAVGILSLPHIVIPPGRAQGIFLYHGWGLIEGLVPYRDMWGNHSPGVYFLYALAVKLSGYRYVGINILEIGWRFLTVLAVYQLAAQLYGRREGIIAAIFWGAWAVIFCGAFGQTAQPESFVVLPIVLAALYYIRNTMLYHVLCGLLTALAVALDADALAVFAAVLLFIIAAPRSTWEPKPKLSKLLGFFHGVIALTVPLVLYFALSYAADDFWRQEVIFNICHSDYAFSLSKFADVFIRLFFFFIPFWIVVWVKGAFSSDERRNHLLFITLLLVVTILMAAVEKGYARHQFFVISGFAAVLASRGLGTVIGFVRSRSAMALRVLAAIIAAAWIAASAVCLFSSFYWHPIKHYRTLDFMTGRIAKARYFGRFIEPDGDINMVENLAVAAYARENLEPSEKFFVWGNEAVVNFWARRFAPAGFFYNYPLIFEDGCEKTRVLKRRWREEFMERISEKPPAMVAVVHRDRTSVKDMDSAALLSTFPEFEKFLDASYRPVNKIGDFDIYRLR